MICVLDPGELNVPDSCPPTTLPTKFAPVMLPVTPKLTSVPKLVIFGCAAVFNVPVKFAATILVVDIVVDKPITKGVL